MSRRRNKSEEQKLPFEKTKLLYESREVVIKLFNDQLSIVSEAKYKKVQEFNTSENLVNEIRQIIYYF